MALHRDPDGVDWDELPCRQASKGEAAKGSVDLACRIGPVAAYDYETDACGEVLPFADPPRSSWLRRLFGEDFFASVTRLHFDKFTLNDVNLARLDGLTELRYLNLGFQRQITDAGLAHLAALPRLRVLSLLNNDGMWVKQCVGPNSGDTRRIIDGMAGIG